MYLSHQLCHSTRQWEILDEEGTLLKTNCQNVTFHQRGCTIWDPDSWKLMVSIGVSWSGKIDIFFIDPQKIKKLTRTVTLICWRLPACRRHYPGSDFEFLQDSVPSHRAKVTQQFLRQSTPDFIAADEWASYSTDPNPLSYCIWDILQDLVYEGWRLPFANLQDLKEAIKNKCREVTIETVWKSITQWKNDWMRSESRMEARFSTFSANCCDWMLISCSETCWNYWLFCTFLTQYSFAYFTVKTKVYNVIMSHTIHVWLFFKNVFFLF